MMSWQTLVVGGFTIASHTNKETKKQGKKRRRSEVGFWCADCLRRWKGWQWKWRGNFTCPHVLKVPPHPSHPHPSYRHPTFWILWTSGDLTKGGDTVEIVEKCRLFIPWLRLLLTCLFLLIFQWFYSNATMTLHTASVSHPLGGGVSVRPVWLLNIMLVESPFGIIHLYSHIYIYIYTDIDFICIYKHSERAQLLLYTPRFGWYLRTFGMVYLWWSRFDKKRDVPPLRAR